MSEIINPFEKPVEICKRCKNRGYYPVLVKRESVGPSTEPPETSVMFCVCDSGRQLRQITIEFRLADLEDLCSIILPIVEKAKGSLHKPEEAGKELQALYDQLTGLLNRLTEAAKEDK